MISIRCNLNDNLRLYGFEHFIQKYGIPIQINDKHSKVYLDYGAECKSEFTIEIKENLNIKQIKETDIQDNLIKHFENKIKVYLDIPKLTGLILSGEDRILSEMIKQKERALSIPIIDVLERMLFQTLLNACKKLDLPLITKTFWPHRKKFAVCLTHDVDEIKKTYQYLTRFLRHLKKCEFQRALYHMISFFTDKLFRRNPYWTFDEIMRIEERLGVRSTFFFLRETAKVNIFDPSTWHHYARKYDFKEPKVANLIRDLISKGWEVGLHGSYFSYMDKNKLKKEKELLEEVAGRIYGIRQHHLNLNIPQTWEYHDELGFDYDCSLGFKSHEGIGFKWGTCFPFHPYANGKTLSLLEIPLTIMDVSITPNEDAWRHSIKLIEPIEEYGGVLTLLWHHTVFNNKEYPGWTEFYKRIIQYCKERNAWVTSAYEVAKWWRIREESKIKVNLHNNTLRIYPTTNNREMLIDVYLPNRKKIHVLSNAEVIWGSEKLTTISIKSGEECSLKIEGASW